MTKKHLVFLMLMVMAVATASASTWRIHNYYVTKKIQNVFDTGDKIYYLNGDRLYQFDKATLKTVSLNRQNKLSDNQISQIYYDWQNKLLFVAYASSNIDVIDAAGKVTNINGIKDVLVKVHDYTLYTSGDHQNELASYVGKEIRDITFVDGKAYVAMGYGYAIIDESTLMITKSMEVRNTVCVNSVTMIGNKLVIVSNGYTYYGDPNSEDPINTFAKKSGTFSGAKMFPIDDHSAFLMSNSRLYYYDFSSSTPALTRLVSALPTSVQKTPTGYIANFAEQTFYYTIEEDAHTVAKQGSAIGFATSDPYGDGTVWINDANGLHVSGSTAYYKMNSLTTDQPYWLKYNAAMNKLYVANSGPIVLINNISKQEDIDAISNIINTYDGDHWSNATAYTAKGGAYAFEFSPVDPTTYVRASWKTGIHKVTNNSLKYTYTSTNSKISTYKPAPAFDNYGNLWVVSSYGNSSAPVVVLPLAKFNKASVSRSDWFTPSGMLSLNTGDMQRSRFLVSKKNNFKFFIDGDYPGDPGNAELFCWDNGVVDPTVDNYRLVNLSRFIDQNDRQVDWTYVNHMEQDKDGNIWVGHTKGVFMFDPDVVFDEQPRAVRPFVTKSAEGKGILCESYCVYDVGVDRDNNKWLATDDGVYFVSPDGSEVYNHFTSENSDLPSNTVYSVECDTVNERVYVYTDNGFAEYIAEGDAAALSFDDVYAFPNPVEPDFTGMIKIANLMENSYVTVTDRDGHVVTQLGPVMGSALWDGSGADGERVPTGIYNIYAAQGSQPVVTGAPQATVMIIR